MLLLPGAGQVRAASERGLAYTVAQLSGASGESPARQTHPDGFANNVGPCFPCISSGLNLWIPLPYLCLCFPFWRRR